MKKAHCRKAFFLLEVMLTVAILSIGLVFVIRSITMSLRVAKQAFNYSKAIHFVYEKANELELIPEHNMFGSDGRIEENGVFESDNNFHWNHIVEKFEDYNLNSIVVDVSWEEGKREGGVGITTYLSTQNETE